MTTNFVWDNTSLPAAKTDLKPVTDPTHQWGAADYAAISAALYDLRTVVQSNFVNVKQYGAKGDGVTDDTAALQAAINATPGRTLYLPRGRYVTSSTLTISEPSHHIVGDYANRYAQSGTEISFNGSGPAIQNGTDNGHSWTTADYDGPQGHLFENFLITHSAPDTTLTSAPGAGNVYKAGAYGIWDWRGGQIVMRNMWIEKFEAAFVGIQSDINVFDFVLTPYSKYGLYIGPRSDQQKIRRHYAFNCDRALTIDGAGQTEVESSQYVFCGHSTASPIEIRQGSHGTRVIGCWLENSGAGYQGTDGLSMISAGEVQGYGAGGSIAAPGGSPNTSSVQGLSVIDPHCYNILAGNASHKRYLISVNKCKELRLTHPTEYINSSLSNFDAIIGIQAANAPGATDTQIEVNGVQATLTLAKIYTNLGAGTPLVAIDAQGTRHNTTLGFDTTASHVIRGSVAYAAPAGTNGWVLTNSNTSQTGGGNAVVQARQNGSYDSTSGAQFPVAMLVQGLATRSAGGNTVRNTALQCQASGGQQNWALESTAGDVQLNTSSGGVFFQRARYDLFEQVATALTTSTNDYAPTNIADAMVMLWSSTGAVNVTGLAGGAAGKRLRVFNTGAFNISITHQDASSSAANRFVCKGAATFALLPGQAMDLYYSPSLSRWLIVGVS